MICWWLPEAEVCLVNHSSFSFVMHHLAFGIDAIYKLAICNVWVVNVYAMYMRALDCEVRECANIYVFVIWKSNQCYIGVLRFKKHVVVVQWCVRSMEWMCIYIYISCYDVLEVWCGFVCLENVVVAWLNLSFVFWHFNQIQGYFGQFI